MFFCVIGEEQYRENMFVVPIAWVNILLFPLFNSSWCEFISIRNVVLCFYCERDVNYSSSVLVTGTKYATVFSACMFQVLYHLRPHIIVSPDPVSESGPDDESILFPRDPPPSPARRAAYVALGAAIASFVFFLIASDRVPRGRIVNNIKLVLEQMKIDWSSQSLFLLVCVGKYCAVEKILLCFGGHCYIVYVNVITVKMK